MQRSSYRDADVVNCITRSLLWEILLLVYAIIACSRQSVKSGSSNSWGLLRGFPAHLGYEVIDLICRKRGASSPGRDVRDLGCFRA